ncbi:DUF4139 domain-containing protein [Luteolibacter yonseiensis]|uniref:DUF4139 domain-containing protein n=1 Tax=Luteolibacter yonseiensis TaxID=1144680 RepID=A0A934R354_9BACT|nr:DUF4139 domain-containing protein [Luteolibacter yonseiensis]MBK1816014.1 DUF4139 domain-containing protein [Luteolibacter yonseiensis]
MKINRLTALTSLACTSILSSQPALTIYNQNFAVVRDKVALDLKQGTNSAVYTGATLHLEPDSVVLRDPAGKVDLRILEQSYRADVLSQGLLLSLNEGKEIDFLTRNPDGRETTIRGKIIRSGYTPNASAAQRYGHEFYNSQTVYGNPQTGGSPIIEVNGQLRFSLPGEPLFPSVGDDTILKPTVSWQLASDSTTKLDAELSYVTGGMSWEAAYNLISPENGDTLDLVGWVSVDNQSGQTFEKAVLKLMAGDVNKIQPGEGGAVGYAGRSDMRLEAKQATEVTEKSFDEYHLYSLPNPTTLRNRETKQVEFLRATGVKAKTLYVYNGASIPWQNYRGWSEDNFREDRNFGTKSNPKVWVMKEFKNTRENGLGIPLPKGRTRFYKQDDADGRPEFTGENTIDHTPQGEDVRIYTGDAFDIVGSRTRTDYLLNNNQDQAEESFEIKLRNRKKTPVEVQVEEQLYRGLNWEIIQKSDDFEKADARNIRFRVTLKPDEERTVSYRVRYNWK